MPVSTEMSWLTGLLSKQNKGIIDFTPKLIGSILQKYAIGMYLVIANLLYIRQC